MGAIARTDVGTPGTRCMVHPCDQWGAPPPPTYRAPRRPMGPRVLPGALQAGRARARKAPRDSNNLGGSSANPMKEQELRALPCNPVTYHTTSGYIRSAATSPIARGVCTESDPEGVNR
jgi:hypothetical protein